MEMETAMKLGHSVNLEEEANNRIRDYIGGRFHGHEFTRLVAAVLQAQGYAVEVAPPGPDGGVDIVAGSGSMGFDPPRICVQVKSGSTNQRNQCPAGTQRYSQQLRGRLWAAGVLGWVYRRDTERRTQKLLLQRAPMGFRGVPERSIREL